MNEKAKILIVEDEQIIAQEMQYKVESMGYNVPAIVLSGEDAIKKAEELRPDLVLMDIIPQGEVDGVEVAGQIRTHLDIPVVYVTANGSDARLEDIKRTDPFGCLFKPFEDIDLHAAIDMALHRYKMEKKLRKSEEKFRTIIESMEDGYYEVDLAGRFTFFNDAVSRITGFPADELMGMSDLEYTEPETAKRLYKTFSEVYRTGTPADVEDYEVTIGNGTTRTLAFNASLIRDEKRQPAGFCGIVRDVTKRKKEEEDLQESETRYRLLAENAADIIWTVDMDMRFTYVSPSVFFLVGYTPEEFLDITLDRILPPASLELVWRVFEEEIAREASGRVDPDRTRMLELEHICKNGSVIWVEIKMSGLRDPDGRGVGILGVTRDITDRRQAEELLRKSEERFRTIFESSKEGYYEIDLAGRFTFFNETMRKISGYSAGELMGMSNLEYTTPETAKKMYKLFNEIYKTGNPGEIGEYAGTAKDGTKTTLGLSAYLMRDEKGEPVGFRGIVRDITDHKRMEEKLEQSYENLRRGLNATINALVAAVEMRDPYTAGHQKHVANLARAIATEMGIPKEKIEGIRMAGDIHDIGKISVPPEILSKPGLLQDIEFDMIKLHPQVGYDILKNIEFPWPVAPIVLQHHERMDGSGYPQGLSGEEICLEARIIAVADVVDAMSSHRPYRPTLGIEKALEEISQNKGTLYDPAVVNVCVRLFAEKGFKLE